MEADIRIDDLRRSAGADYGKGYYSQSGFAHEMLAARAEMIDADLLAFEKG